MDDCGVMMKHTVFKCDGYFKCGRYGNVLETVNVHLL